MTAETTASYRILGPLEVIGGDLLECRIARGRQQVILGMLLLEANRVVSAESLITAVWGDFPPSTARTQIQACISSLRSALGEIGEGDAIVTRDPGYVIQVGDQQIDSQVFAKKVSEANSLIAEGNTGAAELLDEALGLWRGRALSGVVSSKLLSKASELDENRLVALETYTDLELASGRAGRLVGSLRALVAEHPLRERVRGQLMLALYRSGRQAEALETYRAGRLLAIEELGLEPSDELKRLELAVLSGEAALHPAPEPVTAPREAEPAAAPAPERVADPGAPVSVPPLVPFQLPSDTAGFTGRAALIEGIDQALRDDGNQATRIVTLTGPPGAGKSTLAVHVAHRVAARFPHGQLYCDVGGTRAQPLTPAAVLGRFLRALGVPGAALPDDVDERAEMFRHLLADRRVLVVLDNVRSERQLRMLLPGSASCAVLITGGPRITGLAGARAFNVDVFENAEVLEMLEGVIGPQRVRDEAAAAETLGHMVGRLPLALRIVAARLAARPHWSLAWMVERLSDQHRTLDELAHGDLAIRTSLALMYNGLDDDARRLLRLLSLLDGTSIPAWTAAALLDTGLPRAADLLELLVDAQILHVEGTDPTGSPRYKLNGLIRLFAREELDRSEGPEEQRAAVARVVGGWLAAVEEAHRRIYGGHFTVLHGTAPRLRFPAGYFDRVLADPLGWLESERANACAAIRLAADAGEAEACWDLAVSLVSLFEARCYFEDWEQTHLWALDCVREAGARRGYGALMCSLGSLHISRSQLTAAGQRLAVARDVFAELGDVHGQAMTRRNLALLDQRRGNNEAALAQYRPALEEFRSAGDSVGAASVLVHMASMEIDRDNADAAGAHLSEALTICRATGSQRVEVQVRYVLSVLRQRQGRYTEAEEILTGILRQVRERRDMAGESRILHRLGLVNARLGRTGVAQGRLREAIAIRERIMDRVGAAEARLELAQLEVAIEDRMLLGDHGGVVCRTGGPAGPTNTAGPGRTRGDGLPDRP
ncbi:tetratricopeptide repeat protein [Streptomyces sp. NBC_01280]|uniref:AfsR/SARP family transcriptional regulator n=1 Tax=Streptomyces sp. NBC_01280 TaxID=2903810 RepID=UPI002E32E848|nr:BTAD domain-containing putative transcriptional regulator [Streptomyces sp. NBC_01280]